MKNKTLTYGFLFGAGAEIGYGMPSGGKFALDIFKQNSLNSKDAFKERRDNVLTSTAYAAQWLPKNFKTKNVTTYGKSIFQSIIRDTIEQKRNDIIYTINHFDDTAKRIVQNVERNHNKNVVQIIENALDTKIDNISLGQEFSYIDEFESGNELFFNSYFACLLILYKKEDFFSEDNKNCIRLIIMSILQLQVGALSDELSKKINDGFFSKKDSTIDFLDDLGDIFQLDYSCSGLTGLEYLLSEKTLKYDNDDDCVLSFAIEIMDELYSSVLDYKSLIDQNWRYLYCPSSDWGKFTKICTFLFSVRQYIVECANKIDISITDGYYHMLKNAIDDKKYKVSTIATTNYNPFIEKIIKQKICFLNGSTELFYDPYLNMIGKEKDFDTKEKHILVPLMFTQSGTKPITSIDMSKTYVDTYEKWKKSDAIVIVGFGFCLDDEHINGILRTLVTRDDKKLIIVDLDRKEGNKKRKQEIFKALKIFDDENIDFILVDIKGFSIEKKKKWTEVLADFDL